MITTTGLTPTCRCHDLRHEHVVLELLLHEEEDCHAKRQRRTTRRAPRQPRGSPKESVRRSESVSPIARDQREHVEVRHAQQKQTERRRAADDAAEQELTAEPCADLACHPPARIGRHVRRSSRGNNRTNDRTMSVSASTQQVEGEDQDRDEAEDAADESPDGDDHRTDGVRAVPHGRVCCDRFAERDLAR